MEMDPLHSGADLDTSSLVHSDELGRYHEQITVMEPDEQSTVAPTILLPFGNANIQDETQGSKQGTSRSAVVKKKPIQLKQRSASRFYESVEEDCLSTKMSDPSRRTSLRQRKQVAQSRRIPDWIWKVLTAVLGVPSTETSRVWLSTMIYVALLVVAFVFMVFGMWYTVYDIASQHTATTMHIGFVSLFLGFGWLCLGLYSHRLACRLFSSKNFASSVRIHSRTVFKISAAALLVVCGVGFTALNLYRAYPTFHKDTCATIGLYSFVCSVMYISRFCFTVISMIWNLLVGCILLSVCRTHVIGIRLFMKDLEQDAVLYELYWREKISRSENGEFNPETVSILNNSDWFEWEEGTCDLDLDGTSVVGDRVSRSQDLGDKGFTHTIGEDAVFTEAVSEIKVEELKPTQQVTKRQPSTDSRIGPNDELPSDPPIMSTDELLLCYWKISDRMRFTSDCLQRWFASWMSFVLVWCGDYVIYWLSHKPDAFGIIEFILPVLLLLVVCSAYAEANGEGQKMIRCICPTKERFGLLNFLNKQPLQMQTFGLSISYGSMLTVILAFTVAFSSRLILDEVMKV